MDAAVPLHASPPDGKNIILLIPAGFELFGWHWFEGVTTDAPVTDSAVHLIGLEEVVYSANDTNLPSKVNIALCGQAPRGRGRVVDDVDRLKLALEGRHRRHCTACFRQAQEDTSPIAAPPLNRRHKGMAYDLEYARRRTSGRAIVNPTEDDAA
jgi:hypothetical protein